MEAILSLSDALDTATFYGVNNINILCLKNQHPDVRVVARGYLVKVIGSEPAITRFEQNLRKCETFCIKNNTLSEEHILQLLHGEQPMEFLQDNLILHGVNGKSIVARSANQQRLVDAYEDNDLLFAIGPAGSGKTYTAIALAVRALKNREVKRIILSRPAVEAGEKLGFLPGDMKEKIDPYLQPLYDALQDMIPGAKLNEYMERGVIQIAPLAFMRGRTLADAIVILDEATASVDADNESYIQQAISELCKGKTLLVIAHRLNTIAHADCICVIKDGEIAESGDHKSLMDMGGIYHNMVTKRAVSTGWKN